MKYYLCKVGAFQGGGEEEIINDCLRRNVYQYHESTAQKGAGYRINSGDTLILVYKTQILAYGTVSGGRLNPADGYEQGWLATSVKRWIKIDNGEKYPLPYGVFWHTLVGNKQSVVKEIDALWANEIILNITMRNKQEMEISAPALYLHLSTIAAFYQHGLISMPAVQRGKVWNAVRCEVLWDSLLRGIPIGAISLRQSIDGKKAWELFDGQQRVNAINMGFQKFLPLGKTDQRQPILWLDIATSARNTEHEDGKIGNSERKFFFRVTTAAHPWGFKLSDNETRNSVLSASEKREAVERIKDKWDWSDHPGGRPRPHELWPVDAKFPVPFSVLRDFCEQNAKCEFESFWEYCRKNFATTNWFVFFDKEENISQIDQNNWNQICSAIDKMSSCVIVAQNANEFDDRDIGLYFRRMNKAGVVPGDDEIRYSLLKSKVPVLKELDTLAENRMPPAVLANIAMMSYLDKKKWASGLSFKDVRGFAEDFRQYIIGGEIKNLITKIESWLYYSKEFADGLPKCLCSSIARRQRDLYRLLLFFATKWDDIDRKQLVAVVTLVCWYSTDCSQMTKLGYDLYSQCENTPEAWQQCTRLWLIESVKKNWLLPPPPDSAYRSNNTSFMDILSQIDNSGHASSIYRTWAWDGYYGRSLLLYACRKYLNEQFPNYDPAEAVWSEENRPWDYDHIFPRNWLISGKGNKQGQYHNTVARFINSIGNIAPIHFSTNRSKNDDCPGEYQSDCNDALFIDYINNQDFFNRQLKGVIEQDKECAEQFVKITLARIRKLYCAWYHVLAIDSLFDFRDKRRELFESIKSKLEKEYPDIGVYFVAGERQFKCQCNADWARPWLAIGVDTGRDFAAVASNGEIIEIGLRRRPENSNIDGNLWWRDNECETYKIEEGLAEKLVAKLKELIAKSERAKNQKS